MSDDLQRLVVSLEARTVQLDKTIEASNQNLARMFKQMEQTATNGTQAILKQLGVAANSDFGRALSGTLKEGASALTSYAGNLGVVGTALGAAGGAWLGAGAAAGGFIYMLEQGEEKLEAHEQALRRIDSILKATGDASGQTASSIEEMADRMSRSTLQTREDVMNASAALMTFRNVGPDSFEKVMDLAADMSATFGGSLFENVVKLGKAFDDPADGIDRLQRSVGYFSAAQKEVIKNFQQTGDLGAAQKALADDLTEKFGGTAGGQHAGLTGATHDLSEAWDKLLRDFAEASGTNGVTKAIDGITNAVANLDTEIKGTGIVGLLALLGHGASLLSGPAGIVDLASIAMSKGVGGKLPGVNAPNALGAHGLPDLGSDPEASALKALAGPLLKQQQDIADIHSAAQNYVKALNSSTDEYRKSKEQQYVDKKVSEFAKQNNIGETQISSSDRASIEANARAEYIAENATKDGKKAADAAETLKQKLLELQKVLDDLGTKEKEAFAKLTEAQDAALVEMSRGTSGYYAAVDKSALDSAAAKIKAIEAEEKAQIASLDTQREAMAKLGHDWAGYRAAVDTVKAATANKKGAVNAGTDTALGEQGASIREQTEDLKNQALTLGMTTEQAKRYLVAMKANAQADDLDAKGLTEQATALRASLAAYLATSTAVEAQTRSIHDQVEITDQFRSGLEQLGTTGITQFKNLSSAAKDFLLQLAQLVAQLGVMQPIISAMFGQQGTTGQGALGGAMGWLTKLITGAGSSSPASGVPQLSFAADGSLVSSGVPSLPGDGGGGIVAFLSSLFDAFAGGTDNAPGGLAWVGERGPELMKLPGGTQVIPSNTSLALTRAPTALPRAQFTTVAPVFQIDARGAQIGVAEQIDAKMRDYAPALIAESVRQSDGRFAGNFYKTQRDKL